MRGVLSLVAVGALIFAIWWFTGRVAPGGAEAGDCLKENKDVVDCSSSDAVYEVVGKFDGDGDCSTHPSAKFTYKMWSSNGGDTWFTLCLDDH